MYAVKIKQRIGQILITLSIFLNFHCTSNTTERLQVITSDVKIRVPFKLWSLYEHEIMRFGGNVGGNSHV